MTRTKGSVNAVRVISAAAIATAALSIAPVTAQAQLGNTVACGTLGNQCTTALVSNQPSASAKAGESIIKNNLIWFGAQNPNYWNSSDTIVVGTFTPLNLVFWGKPIFPKLWDWFDSQSSQSCTVGFATGLGGPYSAPGTYTYSYNKQGCNPK